MRRFFWAFLILSLSACTSNEPCSPGQPKRIQTIYLSNNGEISYLHEIGIEGVSLNCDSTTVMSLINDYMASNVDKMPIAQIQIFKSMEHFDSGESLSQPKEYLHDRVLTVYLDKITNLPESFAFYDDGPTIWEGKRWKH